MTRNEILSIAKPILFNSEMVRAILDGRKTVTRRIAKFLRNRNPNWTGYIKDGNQLYNGRNEPCLKNPAYRKGDILYVRETWSRLDCSCCEGDRQGECFQNPDLNEGCFVYRATHEIWGDVHWCPSIHMPKEAARIFLRVTDVRVERLQDITGEQAKAEGSIPNMWEEANEVYGYMKSKYVRAYNYLWNSTIKPADLPIYGWDASPWVWVYEFERVIPD